MSTGKIISDAREQKGWSQTDLADKSGVSRVMIGKYERGEAVPSIEAAKKIADALAVSLDYLVGEGINSKFDRKTVARLQDLENLTPDDKAHVFALMDAFIENKKVKSILH
jgi:transcriptional regulator with XRE-family HTH domain